MTRKLQPVTKLKTRHDRPPMRLFSAVGRSERDMLVGCVGSWLPRQTGWPLDWLGPLRHWPPQPRSRPCRNAHDLRLKIPA
jgi:hypothetical protein